MWPLTESLLTPTLEDEGVGDRMGRIKVGSWSRGTGASLPVPCGLPAVPLTLPSHTTLRSFVLGGPTACQAPEINACPGHSQSLPSLTEPTLCQGEQGESKAINRSE